MGYEGQGNQCPPSATLFAFARAAFPDGNGISNDTNVAPMPEPELAAYFGGASEPNPTEAAFAVFRAYL